jgi:hypothetical protein
LTDLADVVLALAAFAQGDLTQTIGKMERNLEGMTKRECASFLANAGIERDLLGAARQMKDVASEIHTLIHAIGIAMCLPQILEKDEKVERASLGAGNDFEREFDLSTDRRVIEFKFSRWTGNDALRRKSLFKDFVKLVMGPTNKAKFLYVLGAQRQLRFLQNSRSDPKKMLNRSGNIGPRFEDRYKGRFLSVTDFYAAFGGERESWTLRNMCRSYWR